MNAAELRKALDLYSDRAFVVLEVSPELKTIHNAARTIALPILEADPELVERIARELYRNDDYQVRPERYINVAHFILAAIITTEEEV